MRVQRQLTIYKELRETYGLPLGQRIKFFWRMALNEMPEIMLVLPISLVSTAALINCMYRKLYDERPPKYFNKTTIYRPDDPRVATIRKDETLRPPRARLADLLEKRM